MEQWINVIESMPTEKGEYLCRLTEFNGDNPFHEVGYFDEDGFRFSVEHVMNFNDVRIEWLSNFKIPN